MSVFKQMIENAVKEKELADKLADDLRHADID